VITSETKRQRYMHGGVDRLGIACGSQSRDVGLWMRFHFQYHAPEHRWVHMLTSFLSTIS
jgi:hypothetical protein